MSENVRLRLIAPPYLRVKCNANYNLIPSRSPMLRRRIALIAVVFASFALAACTSPTAPSQDCGITVGSGCHGQ
jgi:hypothetical protein